ncbi:MAG: YqaA family protein [Planctomycetota bacterium]
METAAPATSAARRGPLRRLYDWVLHWADTRFAVPALFCLSFAESSFFPIPPDVLLIALGFGDRGKAFLFAFWAAVGSVLGGMAGYGIGHFFWEAGLGDLFFAYVPGVTEEGFARMQVRYEEWNVWIVFLAAFTPIPYKLITISAGVFGIDFSLFVLASACGRSLRFVLVSLLIYVFGPPIKEFLDRYLGIVTLAGGVLLVGGFVAAKYLF